MQSVLFPLFHYNTTGINSDCPDFPGDRLQDIFLMKSTLERIEKRLQDLIESSTHRLLSNKNLSQHLASRLITAMGRHLEGQDDGSAHIPNHYTLVLHPSVALELRNAQGLIGNLGQMLKVAAQESGFTFPEDPLVTVHENENISPEELHIVALFSSPLEQTQSLDPESVPDESDRTPVQGAFFIVNGDRVFTLSKPVINIGRRVDNHLVLDDPRVSRLHAQVRLADDRYMIFDLGSTGGTFINENRIHQSYLYPGDVVSLGGVTLVFGQEGDPHPSISPGYTRPFQADASSPDTDSGFYPHRKSSQT
jgi:hypothetical protein